MLDRLLGLSDLRNILDGIKQGKVTDALKSADAKFNGIESNLNAIVTNKRTEIQRHRSAVLAKGVLASSFAEDGAAQLCNAVKAQMDQFADQCSVKHPALPTPT